MGGDLQTAVRALSEKGEATSPFVPAAPARIPDSAGKAANGVPKSAAGGDLTEPNFAARTYHPRRTLKSTDGVITWLYDPIKTVSMGDASGNVVILTFAEPT